MNVIDRLRISIGRRCDEIILRSELADMCSPSQLTNALDKLLKEGALVRLSSGVYAKRKKNAEDSAQSPSKSKDLAAGIFKKLGLSVEISSAESDYDREVVVINGGSHRLSRKFNLGHTVIEYASAKIKLNDPIILPENLDDLPRKNVSEFVKQFALSRHVNFKRSGLDDWAEAVTRASGDDVKLDITGKLLVTLKKKQLINGRQMARLMTNHLREHQSV